MDETDTDTHLALRQSFSARQQQRLGQYFETREEADTRVNNSPPEKANKSHVPNASQIEGDFEQLLLDVPTWPREEVNWSEKARQYCIRRTSDQLTPSNAGQIAKEYLKSNGIDTDQFEKQKGKKYCPLYTLLAKFG